jgi:N-acetylmuramoyl-L-alanine amidase
VSRLVLIAVFLFALNGASAAPARAKTSSPPPAAQEMVSLHDLGRSYGFEVSWLEPSKKLRLKSRTNELIFEVDHREILFNGVRIVMGDAAIPARRTLAISAIDRDRLIVPILNPGKLEARRPVRTILLDPGHGGHDKGTINKTLNLWEKTVALDTALRLQPLLESRGFRVLLTRGDDTFVDLDERAAQAAKVGADLFLSIHFNAVDDAGVRGIETYLVTPQYQRSTGSQDKKADDDVAVPGNRFDGWNAYLGYTMQSRLTSALGVFDRGLKHARFVVIRDLTVCPGLLIEGGFLSHPTEAKMIGDAGFRQKLAVAIAEGVDTYNQTLLRLEAGRAPRPAPAAANASPTRPANGSAH